jgi:KUP system potassium uptake protein
MNDTNIPKILTGCKELGLEIVRFETTYFLSRETVVPTPGGGMMQWREKLFATMSRNSSDIAEFFKLPDNSVVELGTRVQI